MNPNWVCFQAACVWLLVGLHITGATGIFCLAVAGLNYWWVFTGEKK